MLHLVSGSHAELANQHMVFSRSGQSLQTNLPYVVLIVISKKTALTFQQTTRRNGAGTVTCNESSDYKNVSYAIVASPGILSLRSNKKHMREKLIHHCLCA